MIKSDGQLFLFYTMHLGEKRIMASTQFEAIDARRCFPCWDEPMRKAVFEVIMTVPANRTAFSNVCHTVAHGHGEELYSCLHPHYCLAC